MFFFQLNSRLSTFMLIGHVYFFCNSLCPFSKTCFSCSLICRDSVYSGYDYYLLFISVLTCYLLILFIVSIFLENFCICVKSFYYGYNAGKSFCEFVNIGFCRIGPEEGMVAGDLGTFWIPTFMMACRTLESSLQFSFCI